jgi:aryl-alcohol dehydrogenase-like predicted oxidoreductase
LNASATPTVERTELAPGYSISRLLKGGWHLGGGHGPVDRRQAVHDMAAFVEAGVTTFDCADIYLGVEQLIGDFRRAYPELGRRIQVHTKFVPDLAALPTLKRTDIVRIIDRSLQRLHAEQLELVQFFWWDFGIPGAVDAALVLKDLVAEGKIAHLGVTNFTTAQLATLIDAGVPFISNQVQYSLVDRRPEPLMVDYCTQRGIGILTYGQLLGGFISEHWLGAAEPASGIENRSLIKYKLIIDEFGGWALFQDLLRALKRVGDRHGVGVGPVAIRWTLDRPGVAGVIVGATSTRHLPANLAVFDLRLTDEDRAELAAVTDRAAGPLGDCYELEGDRDGPHGRIMRYDQNSVETLPGAA